MGWITNYKNETKVKCGPIKFNKIRVYFTVVAFDSEGEYVVECQEMPYERAKKYYDKVCVQLDSSVEVRLYRVQTGGSIGGIVMSGNTETLLKRG